MGVGGWEGGARVGRAQPLIVAAGPKSVSVEEGVCNGEGGCV